MNKSNEDSGEDRIPNTKNGKDGIADTVDDDILEGDGFFTVENYTSEDLALGCIPPGKNVGDPIPGTGEDIDGDGEYDDTTTLDDIDFNCPLDTDNWAGNMPVGGVTYSNIATLQANRIDAVLYNNHSFCYFVSGSQKAEINGSLACRNENIIYGTPSIEFNYDCRLLCGGIEPIRKYLPKTIQPIRVIRWEVWESDPNKYMTVD